ncbi:hypothetical protein [Sulfurimonas sp.]
MFGKILKKNKEETQEDASIKELKEKISRMNLSDMRLYVNNKLKDFQVCEKGLKEVMKKIVLEDKNTSKRYLAIDDMDTKIKKAFDLVVIIGQNKKVTVRVAELMQEFSNVYADIILKYDTQHKEIYSSRLKDAVIKAIATVGQVSSIEERMDFLSN